MVWVSTTIRVEMNKIRRTRVELSMLEKRKKKKKKRIKFKWCANKVNKAIVAQFGEL